MKKILLIALVLVLPLVANAQVKMNFRNTEWGYSIEQVKKSENKISAFDEKEDMLLFQDKLGTSDVAVLYDFKENKLTNGSYIFLDDISVGNEGLSLFYKFKSLLFDKYGVPDQERTEWKDNVFEKDSDFWGLAVRLGHLSLSASWIDKDQDTVIIILLSGGNRESRLLMSYASISATEEKNKINESSLIDKL